MVHVIYRIADIIEWVMPLVIILRMVSKLITGEVPRAIRHAFFELRPLYLPAHMIVVAYQLVHGSPDWLNAVLGFALAWVIWKVKDDDDRWKRRRKKLAEKVEAVGGKLTVVPVGSPA
jgi:hypothetical protein